MWRLRSAIVALKPDRDPEVERARFERTLRASASVARLIDRRGIPVAILSFRVLDTHHARRPIRLLLGGYGFVDRAHRSSPWVMLMYAGAFLRAASLRPEVEQFFTGLNYPASLVRLPSFGETVFLDGDEGLSPLQRFVLEQVREHLAGDAWDEALEAVDMPTLPEPPSPRWLARYEEDPLFLRFVARVPDWQLGYALPVAMEVSPYRMHRVIPPLLRRARLQLRGRPDLHRL